MSKTSSYIQLLSAIINVKLCPCAPLPQVELTHKSVTFPPCRTDESIHQTVMIVNYGDTPSSFAFQTTGLVPIFTIKPAQGVVPAKGNVLVRNWHMLLPEVIPATLLAQLLCRYKFN